MEERVAKSYRFKKESVEKLEAIRTKLEEDWGNEDQCDCCSRNFNQSIL